MITPTVGRIVWYRLFNPKSVEGLQYADPRAAIITYVHDDRLVNLTVFDFDGNIKPGKTSVVLMQEGDENPGCSYCEWMPYQMGQAAKTEQLQAALESQARK